MLISSNSQYFISEQCLPSPLLDFLLDWATVHYTLYLLYISPNTHCTLDCAHILLFELHNVQQCIYKCLTFISQNSFYMLCKLWQIIGTLWDYKWPDCLNFCKLLAENCKIIKNTQKQNNITSTVGYRLHETKETRKQSIECSSTDFRVLG